MNSITIAALMLTIMTTTNPSADINETIRYEDCHCDFARMEAEGIDEYEEAIRIFEQGANNESEYSESR